MCAWSVVCAGEIIADMLDALTDDSVIKTAHNSNFEACA